MKKLFKILLITVLTVISGIVMFGCGGSGFEASLKNWGEVESVNGFVAQTKNNVYFINGIGDSSLDNSFGNPVKGALVGIAKSDLVAGKLDKAEIVVPKLFVASDYNAGLYVDGDYVYYGSPSTRKEASGSIATGYLAFEKTKLDGSATETFFTIKGLASEYRFAKVGDSVMVLYYDEEDLAIKQYNFNNGETKVIVKKDEKAESESLKDYKFIESEDCSSATVVYSTTIYSEKYYADKADKGNYNRATYPYNKMYSYTIGGEVNNVNGQTANKTYAITYTDGEFVFFTETDISGKEKVFGAKASEVMDATKWVEINDKTALATSTYIVSLTEVYKFSSEENIIYKSTLVGKEELVRKTIAKVTSVSGLIKIVDNNVYYYNTEKEICRVEMNNADAKLERVSKGISTATFYAPEFITVGEKDYMLYVDASSAGASYVAIINLTDATISVDESGENDVNYLEGNAYIGVRTNEDEASLITSYITEATKDGELEYEIKADGTLEFKKADFAISAYEALDESVKKLITEENVNKISNMKKAKELASKYYKLKAITYNSGSVVKADYDVAKAYRTTLINEKVYEAVRLLVPEDFKYYYQETVKFFENK